MKKNNLALKKILFIFVTIFLVVVFSSYLSIASSLEEKNNFQKNELYKEYTLVEGDILDIEVYQEKDLSGSFEINSNGLIAYPLLNSVKVAGLTKQQAEKKIVHLLEKDFLVNPYVRVRISKYHERAILILGCVASPGSYVFPENRKLTLLEAISLAGGFTRYASIGGTKVIRVSPDRTKAALDPRLNDIISGRKKDLPLEPNDLIMVPERIF